MVFHAALPWFQYRVKAIVPFIFFCLWLLAMGWNQKRVASTQSLIRPFWGYAILFFLFHFLSTIYYFFGCGTIIKYYEFATILNAFAQCIVLYFSVRTGRWNEIRFLAIMTVLGILLSGIGASSIADIEGFEGARSMLGDMTNYKYDIESAMIARMLGAANYSSCYSIALFAGSLLWGAFLIKNVKYRIFFLGAVVSSILVVRTSGLGTPVFILAYGMFLFLVGFMCSRRPSIPLFWGCFCAWMLIVYAYKPATFSFLSPVVKLMSLPFPNDSSIGSRLISVCKALEGDVNTYAFTRYQLQVLSLDTFFDNFFTGVGYWPLGDSHAYLVGGHSTLLDTLAHAGIVGGMVFCLQLAALLAFLRKVGDLLNLPRSYYPISISFVMCYLFATIANPVNVIPAFVYHIPGIALIALQYRKPNTVSMFPNGHYA